MELNCQIYPDFEVLNAYNNLYPWIPNSEQIRPTNMNIMMKEKLLDKINNEYNSNRDYILINIFNYPFIKKDNKYQLQNDDNIHLNKFEVCRFRYDIHPDTFHYIMWYTCDKNNLIPKEINRDINRSIFNILKSGKYKYVWYENPKMSIDDVYHVQVFFVKKD